MDQEFDLTAFGGRSPIRSFPGALRPGEELDEKKLAEAFNVSRTPVREALRQLGRCKSRGMASAPERRRRKNHAVENGRDVRGHGRA